MGLTGFPLPVGVHIAFTERHAGVSLPPYDSLNLGDHVGDDNDRVAANRALLASRLGLPSEPCWLEQVHGTEVVCLDDGAPAIRTQADASYSRQRHRVCVVMTADCLPVLLASADGKEVAAAHAGWRGLCDGVLEATLERFEAPVHSIFAYLGPAIGPEAFEVGSEVRAAFCARHGEAAACFRATGEGKYLADLHALARLRLKLAGVAHCYSDERCTFTAAADFFSYRRDGITGRMASLIWRD